MPSLSSAHSPRLDFALLMDLSRVVYDATGLVRFLNKASKRQRRVFAHDLTLVVLSVRCAYLLDAFPLGEDAVVHALSELLNNLRLTHHEFSNIVHAHEPITGQSFFINVNMLEALALPGAPKADPPSVLGEDRTEAWTVFVSIEKDASVMTSIDPALRSLVQQILAHSPTESFLQLTLPQAHYTTPEALLVPLAAFLLEYPIAYVPTGGASAPVPAYLSGVPLDIYECAIKSGTPAPNSASSVIPEHSILLKFSCPRTLGEVHSGLAPKRMRERLLARFALRLRIAGVGELIVNHSVETLDRVAL